MIVHLIDGTYELFRHFYGIRRMQKGDPPFGAVRGVLHLVLQMIETGATHIGVATDHVIESFRNELWDGYKTGYGIEPALWAQFHPLEEALDAMGVVVWPMVELEADDALASAAALAGAEWRCGVAGSGRLALVLREQRERALLFRTLARLRDDAPLFDGVDRLRWRGPTARFAGCAAAMDARDVLERAETLTRSRGEGD